MICQVAISDAITALKSELECGTPAAKAVAWAVDEFEVPENVIRVRFEKAYGRKPEDVTPVAQLPDPMEAALDEAAKRWENPERVKSRPVFGKLVLIDGTKFRYVAHDGRSAMLVSCDTYKIYTYTGVSKVFRQIEAALRVGA